MRKTGKRTLAGIAAGALGLALIPFVGAGVSQAAIASIALDNTGLSVVQADDSTPFQVTIAARNAAGELTNIDDQSISATVTSVPGGGAFAQGTDAGVDDTNVGSVAAANSVTPANPDTGIYRFWVTPQDDTQTNNWDDVAAGNYNIRVSVTTTATGSTITRDFPMTIFATDTTPIGSFTWTDATNTSIVNSASGEAGEDANGTVAYAKLTTSDGRALLLDPAMGTPNDALTADLSVATASSSTAAAVSGGLDGDATSSIGVYTVTPNGDDWVAGANAINLSYNTPTAFESSLPVTIGTDAVTASTVALTTTPRVVDTASATAPEYTVPAGTTSLAFTAATATATSTAAWSTTTDAVGGEITTTAGVAAISSGAYAVSVQLNAAAAAAGRSMTFVTGSLTATVNFANNVPTIVAATPLIAKIGDAVTITGTLLDQFERPLTGASIVSVARQTPTTTGTLASGTPDATGVFSLTVPAAAGPTSAATYSYRISASSAGTAAQTFDVSVRYTAEGEVTSLTGVTNPVSVSGRVPATVVPGAGTVNLANVTDVIADPAAPAVTTPVVTNADAVATVSFTSVPATSVTLSVSEGGFLSTTTTGTVAWNAGVTDVTVASGTLVRVWGTQSGVTTVTATAGGKAATVDIYVYTLDEFARNITMDPTVATVAPNTFTTVTAEVTDVFGNPVPGVTAFDNTDGLSTSLAGAGSVTATASLATTDAEGKTTFFYTSPEASGTARVMVTGSGLGFATSITGQPAPIRSAATTVTVSANPGEQSIVLTGDRQNRSIVVDGATTGLPQDTVVRPWIKFPGQTSYTQGVAQRTVNIVNAQDETGEFTWQRRTGKKTYVYFRTADDSVQSTRVIIPAR